MSIIVDGSKMFDVTVYWQQVGKKLQILEKKPDVVESGAITESVTVSFRYPDYQIERQIQRSSVSANQNGSSVIDNLTMQSITFQLLVKKWDLQENGKAVELTVENIGRLHPVVMREVIALMYVELAESGFI